MKRRAYESPFVPPRPATLAVACVLALGAVGSMDYADEIGREAEAKALRPIIASADPDPTRAPQCPPRNVEGERLERQIAHQADGGHWMHDCKYHEEVRL